jgi:hypothetical protein
VGNKEKDSMHKFLLIVTAVLISVPQITNAKEAKSSEGKTFVDSFSVNSQDWSSKGSNPYFVLEPGYRLIFDTKDKAGHLEITVLDETKTVDGVETRVVEEKESEEGKIIEISRNYFAISKKDKSVYYFGEDVDMYKDGKVTGHAGSWLAGVNGAKFGMIVPGNPTVGARYYQEVAVGVAQDRSEIISVTKIFETPAGKFENCLVTEETTPIEKDVAHKIYGKGVGLLSDGELKLVEYGPKK